jgi:glycosyltransferase involved in cell wall biosynthesis
MKNNPLVSIVIDNYNYGQFLRDAINSALNQSYANIEIILVDDGSTDDSREIIASYGDKILPVLKENGGQASAFNAGFDASSGELICFLDSDDILMPEKVAEIVTVFECYPDIGWCFHPLRLVNELRRELMEIRTARCPSGQRDFRAYIQSGKRRFSHPATSGLCFSRSLLKLILPMPEAITITSDNYLKFAAFYLERGFFIERELASQRIHCNNAYTLRKDKPQLRASVDIIIAYWLKIKFPKLKNFTNKLFAEGVGTYWRFGGVETPYRTVANSYWKSLPLSEKIEVLVRCLYHRLKA